MMTFTARRDETGKTVFFDEVYDRRIKIEVSSRTYSVTERCTIGEWLKGNDDDEKMESSVPRILAGETVRFGGGAAPTFDVSLDA